MSSKNPKFHKITHKINFPTLARSHSCLFFRELLQDSSLIRKLRTVLTNRILRFLQERARKENKSFMEFYKDYGFFLKEGIVTSTDSNEKQEIAKLLR